MSTPQLRWPTEVENQRNEALRAVREARHCLQEAQVKTDQARAKLYHNTSIAAILLTDAARLNADAQTGLEHVQLALALARATPLKGRWGVGAAARRDDSDQAARAASTFVHKILAHLETAQEKLGRHQELAETIIAKISQWQSQALAHVAQIERLLTEAGIGRI